MSTFPEVGDRIELIRTADEYTALVPGDTGVVTGTSRHPSGQRIVSVNWDTGSALMLLDGVDEWRVLPKPRSVR